MKISPRHIILSLMVMIFFGATSMLSAIEPVGVKQPITTQGVHFSTTVQNLPLTSQCAMPLLNIPPPPAPLNAAVRLNAVNQIRGAAGLKPIAQLPQPIVVLTPYAPKSGQSNYRMYYSTNLPSRSISRMGQGREIVLTFSTISGQTYMVDLFLNSFNKPLKFYQGFYDGYLTPLNGHVTIGFTATSSTSYLHFRSDEPAGFDFFRCELTRASSSIEPIAAKQSITMQGVYFSKTLQNLPLTSTAENIPSPPAPLDTALRLNAINQIRAVVGLNALIQPWQPTVVLTPDAPMFGQNFYNICTGDNIIRVMQNDLLQTGSASVAKPGYFLQFVFNTIPGQSYMIDLFAYPRESPMNFKGIYTGSLTPLDGHITIGFTANSSASSLVLAPSTPYMSIYFFRCELTKVN